MSGMSLYIKVWRQASAEVKGEFVIYTLDNVSQEMSFLEMLDLLNEQIIKNGEVPIEFDSDCREGICGTCGCVINGHPHGPEKGTTTCQLHMRKFHDKQTITVEPWRSKAFPVIKDLVVDRSAFDRIIASGGYISTKTGPHAEANAILVPKDNAETAFESAACIGCGACVAACPNASAALFASAKISHLALLPQGQVEATRRVQNMVQQMDVEGFGNCSNIGDCEAACPKQIPIENISRMKREFIKSLSRCS